MCIIEADTNSASVRRMSVAPAASSHRGDGEEKQSLEEKLSEHIDSMFAEVRATPREHIDNVAS